MALAEKIISNFSDPEGNGKEQLTWSGSANLCVGGGMNFRKCKKAELITPFAHNTSHYTKCSSLSLVSTPARLRN